MARAKKPYWTTARGERVLIEAMEDRHLINAIRSLERQAAAIKGVPYPTFQGEMAQYSAEQGWEELQAQDLTDVADELHPRYADLVEEAERRGLTWEPPV